MFREEEHPRDKDGKFTDGKSSKSEKVAEAERIYNSELPYVPADGIKLTKQEYAILRKEVMRKNSEQKGKVKSINSAFTANTFYIYSTKGDDDFTLLKKFDIEKDRYKINAWLLKLGE